MKTANLKKFLAIIFFLLLIAVFISYRPGAFANNKNNIASASVDTIPVAGKAKPVRDTLKGQTGYPVIVPSDHTAWKKKLAKDSNSLRERKRKKVMLGSTNPLRVVPENNRVKRDTVITQNPLKKQ